ncbi:MAG: TRAM domain-containing protein [Gemmataceae bacterium]|nr:TRAM domain-containing protein [Gemmataceae bacterium]MDW8241703.1 TRAM domain-containing protein [Thermogemmata sp.]
MLLPLLRATFIILVLGLTAYAASLFVETEQTFLAVLISAVALGISAIVLITDIREKHKNIATISAIYFGLLLGLLVGWLLSLATGPLLEFAFPSERRMVQIGQVFIIVISCYVAISTLLQTKDEFRFIIPYVEFSKQVKGGRPLVLDTSAIIDGRIADICDTRLIDTKLIVPRFVLQELQAIADSSDRLKRNRGRRGLDILKRLQTNPKIELEMHDGNVPELHTHERIRVDERLVLLAKALNARVVTNDFNLNKIAQLQGVDVINLNELANALKTVALPGETMTVRVVKPGDQVGQGVGYLDDGTMVVVEQGRPFIGQETTIVVTSVLQTPAGRMIFGRPDQRASGTATPYPGGSSAPAASTKSSDSTASHVSLGNRPVEPSAAGGNSGSSGTGTHVPLGNRPTETRSSDPPRSTDDSR